MTSAPPDDAPEHVRARYWREHVAKMSRPELGELIGYSVSTIGDIEAGMNRITRKPIDPQAMKRYRLLCAAAGLGIEFDWGPLRMTMTDPVALTMWGTRTKGKRR